MELRWLLLSACVVMGMVLTARAGRGDENADATQASWAAAQAPWASKAQAGDVVKDHVETIADGHHAYTIGQGGTLDGRSCRTPLGCGMMREGAIEQTWESNRAVRMENAGDTNVINPWLSNGQNNFRTVQEIVAAAVKPGMTDAEKAFALWYQEIRHRYHAGGDNNELGNPVRVFNVYGYNTCGNDSIALGGLWQVAGMRAAPARAIGHCISQVFYDNAWHMFDGDMHSLYLARDNKTVAGDLEIERDPDLVKRTHNYGILWPDTRSADEGEASLFVSEAPVQGEPRLRPWHDHGHDAPTRRVPDLAVGTSQPGQVPRPGRADLPGHHLQRAVGIPAGLHERDLASGRGEC